LPSAAAQSSVHDRRLGARLGPHLKQKAVARSRDVKIDRGGSRGKEDLRRADLDPGSPGRDGNRDQPSPAVEVVEFAPVATPARMLPSRGRDAAPLALPVGRREIDLRLVRLFRDEGEPAAVR